MFITETAVPVKEGCWSAGSEKDEVSFKAFLVDDRSAFERGEDGAFGLREPKAGFDERVDHERGIDGNQELFKAGVLKRGDGNRFAIAGEADEFLGRGENGRAAGRGKGEISGVAVSFKKKKHANDCESINNTNHIRRH